MKKITFLVLALMGAVLMNAQYNNMAIVGDGASGWPPEVLPAGYNDATQMTSTDGIHWTYANLVTHNGSVKFRTDNSWAHNWGAPAGGAFPAGVGVSDSQTNISTPVGVYNVTFNSTTLEYNFTASSLYPTISLIGPGVGTADDDWNTDVDLGTTDGVHYAGTAISIHGTVKFRKNHDWPSGNWAPLTFPSGTAIADDPGALTVANNIYNVTFNLQTLEYAFSFRGVAIVGSATPTGWPPSPQPEGYVDPHQMTTTDGNIYTINNIVLAAGAAKFRQDNNWNVQWGGDGNFPNGTGSQNGTDIPVTAGTYDVTLNRATGTYGFAPAAAATVANTKNTFKVYPNPSQNVWNVASNDVISTIQVVDMTGKVVMSISPKSNTALVDATQLSAGIYIAKVTSATTAQTVRLVKN